MRSSLTLATLALTAACAGSSGPGPAAAPPPQAAPTPAPAPTAAAPRQAAATAAAPTAAKDIDPTGNYNVSLTYGGMPLTLYLQLWKKEDGTGFTGGISAEQVPNIPLNSVAVSGKKVTATLSSPDGSAISMEFTIDGEALSGSWRSSGGDGSQMSGRRAP